MSFHNTHTDEQLLSLLQRGDEEAFNAIYLRYEEALSSYALQITQNSVDAVDIVQDIFVSLWFRRKELYITHSLKAWLYQAIRFRAAKYIAQNIRKHHFLERLSLFLNSQENTTPDLLLESIETSRRVEEVVNSMPEKMKIVYVLSREKKLSHREISKQLGIAENTVKKHIQNALKLIKSKVPSYSIIACFAMEKMLRWAINLSEATFF